ncbi:hypothetical protein BIWAKO_04095 [Bosea sp. BIWAKO-01]|nr:hypothetical protein BIWAKO_04095 [Bosea sp. BIWAKO-01]
MALWALAVLGALVLAGLAALLEDRPGLAPVTLALVLAALAWLVLAVVAALLEDRPGLALVTLALVPAAAWLVLA